MPICPGCEQKVPYQKLDIHQRYCESIWGEDRIDHRTRERLEARIETMEKRLDERLQEVDRRVKRMEQLDELLPNTPSQK